MTPSDQTPDPLEQFERWYADAQPGRTTGNPARRIALYAYGLLRSMSSLVFQSANLFRPDVATLATVTADGKPAARSVIFQGLVDEGFTFYTDYGSTKGREIDANPAAVLLFYWSLPPRQVRIDGHVRKLPRDLAEAYWQGRTRDNQAAAAAMTQSSVVASREVLLQRKREIEARYAGRPIPCPPSWGGYRLEPERIEFWEGRGDWVHHRERYTLAGGRWERVVLAP